MYGRLDYSLDVRKTGNIRNSNNKVAALVDIFTLDYMSDNVATNTRFYLIEPDGDRGIELLYSTQ
jgi:hypothetical protein